MAKKYYVIESYFYDGKKPIANLVDIKTLDYRPDVVYYHADGYDYYKDFISRKDEAMGYLYDIRKQGGTTKVLVSN